MPLLTPQAIMFSTNFLSYCETSVAFLNDGIFLIIHATTIHRIESLNFFLISNNSMRDKNVLSFESLF